MINRFAARIGKAAAPVAIAIAAFAFAAPVHAQSRSAYVFDGKSIVFSHVRNEGGHIAVGIDDSGLKQLLDQLGATVTWQNGQRYVLVTTAEPLVITFVVGDRRYDVGQVAQQASFAPFLENNVAFVPLVELLHGLNLDLKRDGAEQVLQPQITAIDVQASAAGVKVVAHAGTPLSARVIGDSNGKVSIAFDGVGTTLERTRNINAGGIRTMELRTDGSARSPRTVLTLTLAPGVSHSAPATDDQRDFTMSFGSAKSIAAAPSAAPIANEPQDVTTAQPQAPQERVTPQFISVSDVTSQSQNGSFVVNIAVDSNATFEWHRLRPPDNRFWLDVHNARLIIPPKDDPGSDPVQSVRVHQVNPQTVRVALSLADFDDLTVTPNDNGITITVQPRVADNDAPRAGNGTTGSNAVAYATPAPPNGGWKFGNKPPATSTYVPANPKLIVIDPGHGGTDVGAMRNGVAEKTLALDMSKRLRSILVARGWQVMMTRSDDRDVFGPNASDRDELQARVDVANNNGARLFVSVHVNSFINAGPRGTTTFFYKPTDNALAQAIQRRLVPLLSTKDDGVQKDKLYVLNHSLMPAALVETAFISNPDDFEKLSDPQWRQRVAQAIADGIGDYVQAGGTLTAESH
ncbi:MAG: N-acetylmuramoyl-L-alanine amidase [Candidatus Eremiobacteraeota bacterium]|nr:N-acetylmuramoyl-L-alanine amidase [Candidatus Eremiobacteraeota bacterium]